VSDLSNVLHDLDQLMESAQREADAARDRQVTPKPVEGSALDGKVKVRLAADGRVSELLLADEVMGLSPRELGREIASAFNLAWAAARSDDPAAAAVAAVDPAALAESLRQVREEGMRSMQKITDALADTMRQIDRRLT
jgi:DNA-binding protein YbaB